MYTSAPVLGVPKIPPYLALKPLQELAKRASNTPAPGDSHPPRLMSRMSQRRETAAGARVRSSLYDARMLAPGCEMGLITAVQLTEFTYYCARLLPSEALVHTEVTTLPAL